MLANIISAIDKKIFEPVVVCPEGDGNEQLRGSGARVIVTPRPIYQFLHYTGYSPSFFNPYFIKHALMLWRDRGFWETFIRESGAKIVCLNAMTLSPMAYAAKKAGASVLCIFQETAVRGWLGLRTRWLYHILSSWMEAVVFISNYDRVKSNCRAPLVEVIPNWINLDEFNRAYPMDRARYELDIPQDSRVILMMGGIDTVKGTLQLIRAVAMLADIPELMVVIAGYSGPVNMDSYDALIRLRTKLRRMVGQEYRQKVFDTIEKKGLSDRIRFVGMQSDVVRIYAAADILVFPATRPHQARPVLEAGAMGKPVVVPDFPQTHEFIENGYNGLTYPHDVGSLAAALRKLIEDPALARVMGENNFGNTCTHHNESLNAEKFQRIFLKLAGE